MISVVIPTHNRKLTLKRALCSVLNQTVSDLDIIVVSDGSTDGTNELIEEFAQNDKRIRLIDYRESKGGNYARNMGVKVAYSEYIAFLDDDDEWLPQKLEAQMAVFDSATDIGLVYTGIDIIYKDDGYRYITVPKYRGDLSKEILIHNCITTTSSVMIKKSLLEKAGLFDEKLSALQDYDLWIRCCQITHVGCVEMPLVNYYVSASAGQITANTEKNRRAFEQIERKYQEFYRNLSEEENMQRKCNKFCGLATYAFKNGNNSQCRNFAAQAFKAKKCWRPIVIFISSLFGIKIVLKLRNLTRILDCKTRMK